MRKWLWLSGSAALIAIGAAAPLIRGAPGDAAAADKLNTASVKLKSPEVVLSRPLLPTLRLFQGMVLPDLQNQRIMILPSASQPPTLTLAGEKITFATEGQGFILKQGEKATKLERVDPQLPYGAFQSVTVQLGGRDYVLAFPYGVVYQGLGADRKPVTQGYLTYRSGGIQQFVLDGQKLAFYDSNTDGVFRPADDAIGFATPEAPMNVFAPAGKFLTSGKAVYEIKTVAQNGSSIEVVPFQDRTGDFTLAINKTDLHIHAAFLGDKGMNFVANLEPTKAEKLVVAADQYRLAYGLAYSPELKKVVATVAPGNMARVTVQSPADVQLGGPFRMTATYKVTGKQLAISSSAFGLFGKAGEEYRHFEWETEPTISILDQGQATPLGKMKFG